MNRRQMLMRALAAGLAGTTALPAAAQPGADAQRDRAFNYIYPLFEFARASRRVGLTAAPNLSHAERLNRIFHRRGLADHTARQVTAPNNDTLYSTAFLDLSGGPLVVNAPTVPDRYFSIAFMNAFTDNFHYIGSRATGGIGGRLWLVGPDDKTIAPAGVSHVRADTNDVWMLARVLVTGPDDLPAARSVQDAITLDTPAGRGPSRGIASTAENGADAAQILDAANEMLGRQVRRRGVLARAHNFDAVGIRPDNAFAALPESAQQAWRAAATRGVARLRDTFRHVGAVANGWTTPPPDIGNFGRNDLLRAAVALGGIGALGREEAMYFSSVSDANGQPLSADTRYLIRMPAAGPPVDAFWSVTMYAAEPDGRFFFAQNPINRFSIGDRTPGLVRRDDGAIDIVLSRAPPDPHAPVNWLPMPDGPFQVTFRAYAPRPAMIAGRWFPPPLQKIA